MEVLHAHCAGLDLHKESVVASVRHMVDGEVTAGVQDLQDNDEGTGAGVRLVVD